MNDNVENSVHSSTGPAISEQDPGHYHKAAAHLLHDGTDRLPRPVKDSMHRPDTKGSPTRIDKPGDDTIMHGRAAGLARGTAKFGAKVKKVAVTTGEKKRRDNTDKRGTGSDQ
jgi:hypothetical protein